MIGLFTLVIILNWIRVLLKEDFFRKKVLFLRNRLLNEISLDVNKTNKGLRFSHNKNVNENNYKFQIN